MSTDFTGAGWAFPVRTDATGSIALVTREREIEEAIRIILGTAPGERPMRPEFGCRIHDFVFGPSNAVDRRRDRATPSGTALERWEPRIDVVDVRVGFDGQDGNGLRRPALPVRGVNDPRNLVFPFYVIPDQSPSNGRATRTHPRTRRPRAALAARSERRWP